MYLCMYVCLLIKDSVTFDPHKTRFTQNIREGTGCVNSYIRPKSVKILEIGQDFSVEFSFKLTGLL